MNKNHSTGCFGLILLCISFFGKYQQKRSWTTNYFQSSRPTLFFSWLWTELQKTYDRFGKKAGVTQTVINCKRGRRWAGKADRDHSKRCSQSTTRNTKQSHARSKVISNYAYQVVKKLQDTYHFKEMNLCRSFYGKYVCLILSSRTWK